MTLGQEGNLLRDGPEWQASLDWADRMLESGLMLPSSITFRTQWVARGAGYELVVSPPSVEDIVLHDVRTLLDGTKWETVRTKPLPDNLIGLRYLSELRNPMPNQPPGRTDIQLKDTDLWYDLAQEAFSLAAISPTIAQRLQQLRTGPPTPPGFVSVPHMHALTLSWSHDTAIDESTRLDATLGLDWVSGDRPWPAAWTQGYTEVREDTLDGMPLLRSIHRHLLASLCYATQFLRLDAARAPGKGPLR